MHAVAESFRKLPSVGRTLANGTDRDHERRLTLVVQPTALMREVAMSPPSFLVLDLDGTISDPTIGFARSINYALQHFGYPPVPDAAISRYIGPPLDFAFRELTGTASGSHIAELAAKYRERYGEIGYAENTLYPGMAQVLRQLSESTVPLGICTTKRADFAERTLELFELRQHFRFISGGDIDIGKQQQLRSLLSRGVISPASQMVGDRASDIQAARANCLTGVGVLWGHGSREELEAAGPDLLLEVPEQLGDLPNGVRPVGSTRPG